MCLAVWRYKLLPLLFYYDTRISLRHIDLLESSRSWWQIKAPKSLKMFSVFSFCFILSLQGTTFNYDFYKLVSSILSLSHTPEDDNGCRIIGTINCIRFVTFYKTFSLSTNASLIIFTQWISVLALLLWKIHVFLLPRLLHIILNF